MAFLDWRTGRGVTDVGGPFTAPTPTPAAGVVVEMAAAAGVERVLITGPRPYAEDASAFHAWAHLAPEGWETAGHYLERPDAPVLRFREPHLEFSVELARASTWWGPEADPDLCRAAWAELGRSIGDRWPGAVLLSSPATTGRELVARSIPFDVEWPTLPAELAELVRSTSGQGRIEFRPPATDTIPAFYEVDGRQMYGALCRELPGGIPQRGAGEHQHGPYARCRVRAYWQVPRGWDHLGLLPARGDDGQWTYPATPGETASGWIDGAELALARAQGWPVTVAEHLVWPKYSGAGPLDGWARRLLDLIATHKGRQAPRDALVAAALRHVLIDTLGALVGRSHLVTRSAPEGTLDQLPAGALDPRWEAGQIVWAERRPPAWPEMVHPEWSASVWARCRVRMLDGPGPGGTRTGALHLDPATVLAVRTDALYLTADPGWPDDGRAGRLRVKGHRPGPIPTPATVGELLGLRGGQ